jgi:uncharacterized protein YgiM (DUF1202 family)
MKTNMTILRFAILLVCLNALSSTSALAQPAPPRNVRVTSQVLNVRSGPGLKFAIVTKVRRGTVLRVIRVRHGWLHVRRSARSGLGKFGGYGAHTLIVVTIFPAVVSSAAG